MKNSNLAPGTRPSDYEDPRYCTNCGSELCTAETEVCDECRADEKRARLRDDLEKHWKDAGEPPSELNDFTT